MRLPEYYKNSIIQFLYINMAKVDGWPDAIVEKGLPDEVTAEYNSFGKGASVVDVSIPSLGRSADNPNFQVGEELQVHIGNSTKVVTVKKVEHPEGYLIVGRIRSYTVLGTTEKGTPVMIDYRVDDVTSDYLTTRMFYHEGVSQASNNVVSGVEASPETTVRKGVAQLDSEAERGVKLYLEQGNKQLLRSFKFSTEINGTTFKGRLFVDSIEIIGELLIIKGETESTFTPIEVRIPKTGDLRQAEIIF